MLRPKDERWRPIKPLLNTPKKIEQNRDHSPTIQLKQILGFEGQKTPFPERVHFGI